MKLYHSERLLGGPGSGNFGHAGRPGERGGSQKGTGGIAKLSSTPGNIDRVVVKSIDLEQRSKRDNKYDIEKTAAESARIAEYSRMRYMKDGNKFPERSRHWVVVGDDADPRGIGYVYIDPDSDHVYIEGISNSDVTRPGVGTKVINYASKLAKDKGLKKVKLEYTDNSKPYYEKKGWKIGDKYAELEI